MTMYATTRGELLARLEHRCIEPGLWEVEGVQVRQLQSSVSYGAQRLRPWLVVGAKVRRYPTFARALSAIADAIDKGAEI